MSQAAVAAACEVSTPGPQRAAPAGPAAALARRGRGQARAGRGSRIRGGRRMRCRCCRTRRRGRPSGRWPGSGCWARAPGRCSRQARGTRWPGCCWRCPRWREPGCWPAPAPVYGRLRNGFYGLEMLLVVLVFLALLREPRAEGATRVPPAALGRVLGLDRAPEVKTIRRKLAELAAAGKAADLQLAIARQHAAARPDTLGFLLHRRAHPRLLRHPGRAEDARRAAEVPRPGNRGDLGHRRGRGPAAGRHGRAVHLAGRPDQGPAAGPAGHLGGRRETGAVLRPGRLVPGPVRLDHHRRVRPAHLPQGRRRQGHPRPA